MTEIAEDLRSRSSKSLMEKREKLSIQSAFTKFDLKKTLLSDILTYKNKYQVFNVLATQEERSERIWLYIDKEGNLRGPFTCKEMQQKFENNELEPATKIKKKLDENFSQMCHLLSHFCKISLIEKFEGGSNVEEVMRLSMSGASEHKSMGSSVKNLTFGLETWMKGMKKNNNDFGGIRPYSTSYNAVSSKPKENECISMVFNKPKVFDKSRKSNMQSTGNPPEQVLFSKIQEEFCTPQKPMTKMRGSYNTTSGGNEAKKGGTTRPRVNTTSNQQSKKHPK